MCQDAFLEPDLVVCAAMTKDECARNAAECSHMAGLAKGTDEKISWLRLADSWLRLACASQGTKHVIDSAVKTAVPSAGVGETLTGASSGH